MNDMDREPSTPMHPTPPILTQKKTGSGIVVSCPPPHLTNKKERKHHVHFVSNGTIVEDMLEIKAHVLSILERVPVTRDSDKVLIVRFLIESGLAFPSKNGLFIPYKYIDDLPNFESIRRARQKIQEPRPPEGNGMGLFPSSEVIRELRDISRCEMHELMQGSLEVPVVQRRLDL